MLSPRENLHLFGHTSQKELFLNAFHSSRFSHAWVFAGEFGIGKATFAFHMARYILSGRSTKETIFLNTEPLCRRIVVRSQENLWVLGEDATGEIGVEAVRSLISALTQTSREGGWRIIIIDGAERLNRHAANALLKCLEAPPSKTVFFLLTSLPGHLLATLRSRCQFLFFPPLEEKDLQQVLASQGWNLPHFSSLAEGSPGRLLRLLEEEGSQILDDLQLALKEKNISSFINAYGSNESSYPLVEDLLRNFLYTTLISKVKNHESPIAMLETHTAVTHLFERCYTNQLDKKTTLACVLNEITK